MEAQQSPGLAIAIVHNGEVVFAEGFGVRNTETNARSRLGRCVRAGRCSRK